MHIGLSLRKYREFLEVTRVDLATRTKKPYSTFRARENRENIRLTTLVDHLSVLNTKLEVLVETKEGYSIDLIKESNLGNMVGGSLKRFRERVKVSQTSLARRLNISKAAVSKFETRNNPELSILVDYVTAIGCDITIQTSRTKRTMEYLLYSKEGPLI